MPMMERCCDPNGLDSSSLFHVIGEKHRLRLLNYLLSEPNTVESLRKKTRMEKTLLSKHLKALRSAGLVYATRSGKNLLYSINPEIVSTRRPRALVLECCTIELKKI